MHKFIFQCTNIFSSAQIYFSVHKFIFQCTNIFFSAQIYFPVHKYIFQCTNLFSSAQIYFSVHKFIFQCTNIFPVHKCVFQCTNIFSSAQICNWRPGYHCLPAPNWLPFCTTKTITTRPEGLMLSILESMFGPRVNSCPGGFCCWLSFIVVIKLQRLLKSSS